MIVIPLEVGPLATNAYLLGGENSPEGAVIDPGDDGERLVQRCRSEGIEPLYIIDTHSHWDHIGGNAVLKSAFPRAELCIGADDADALTDPIRNLAGWLGVAAQTPPADVLLREGHHLRFGSTVLSVLDTPGHTPGGISLLCEGTRPAQMFCGDLVFRRAVGRVDFPGGSEEQLLTSIRQKVLTLPDDTILWPGHGPRTTVGEERRENPFFGVLAGG